MTIYLVPQRIDPNYQSSVDHSIIENSKDFNYDYLFFALGIIILIGSLIAACCLHSQVGYRSLIIGGGGLVFGLGLLSIGYYYRYNYIFFSQLYEKKKLQPVWISQTLENKKKPVASNDLFSNSTKIDEKKNLDNKVTQKPISDLATDINLPEYCIKDTIAPDILNANQLPNIIYLATQYFSEANRHTDSGNLHPDKSILDFQLNPSSQTTKDVESSSCKGATVPLSTNVYSDLTRLGTLIINNESIYDNEEYQLQKTTTEKTTYIFNKLEEKLSSITLAVHAANLMEQNLWGEILKQIVKTKGLVTEDDARSTHAVTNKKGVTVLKTNGKKFKLTHEELVQKALMENIEDRSFFKIKTVIQGSLESLESKNSKEMSIETVYTKEHTSMQEACNDTYSFFDRKSYLKV